MCGGDEGAQQAANRASTLSTCHQRGRRALRANHLPDPPGAVLLSSNPQGIEALVAQTEKGVDVLLVGGRGAARHAAFGNSVLVPKRHAGCGPARAPAGGRLAH